MERDDIIGGLKSALALGEPLNHAVMTFINAGYKREEVEAAARSLNMQGQQPQQIQPSQQQNQNPQNFNPPANTTQQRASQMPVMPQQKGPQQKPNLPAVQRISRYEQPKGRFGIILVVMLAFVLLILVGILVGVVFFRETVAGIFSGLLGNG